MQAIYKNTIFLFILNYWVNDKRADDVNIYPLDTQADCNSLSLSVYLNVFMFRQIFLDIFLILFYFVLFFHCLPLFSAWWWDGAIRSDINPLSLKPFGIYSDLFDLGRVLLWNRIWLELLKQLLSHCLMVEKRKQKIEVCFHSN